MKYLGFILVLVLVLAGCGPNSNPTPNPQPDPEPDPEPEPKPRQIKLIPEPLTDFYSITSRDETGSKVDEIDEVSGEAKIGVGEKDGSKVVVSYPEYYSIYIDPTLVDKSIRFPLIEKTVLGDGVLSKELFGPVTATIDIDVDFEGQLHFYGDCFNSFQSYQFIDTVSVRPSMSEVALETLSIHNEFVGDNFICDFKLTIEKVKGFNNPAIHYEDF